MKPPKTLIRIGFILLIAVAAVLVVRAVFNYTEGRKLTASLAGLKAQGIPLTANDLAAPCPDEENGARLWKAAENLLTTEKGENRKILGVFGKYVGGDPLDQSSKAALKRLAAENERALGLVMEIGAKPCFLFRDPAAILIEALMPRAIKMIETTKLLGFSALFMAEDGDVPGAIDKILSGLRFTPMVAREGFLMPYLIAVADTRMLTYFLGDICRGRTIDDATLLRLIADLDPGPWRERLAAAIRGERVLLLEAGTLIDWRELRGIFDEPSILKNIGMWLIRPVIKVDVRKTLPVYQEIEAWTRLAYFECRDALRSQAREFDKRPWYAFLSKAWVRDFESTFLKEAQLEATLLAARTGLACRLYKSRTGSYPETLDRLVPGILTEVPIDPFTGKPLVYRREGEGFIVYSFGSNQKDDGGRSTYMITRLVMDKDDDWTWKEDK